MGIGKQKFSIGQTICSSHFSLCCNNHNLSVHHIPASPPLTSITPSMLHPINATNLSTASPPSPTKPPSSLAHHYQTKIAAVAIDNIISCGVHVFGSCAWHVKFLKKKGHSKNASDTTFATCSSCVHIKNVSHSWKWHLGVVSVLPNQDNSHRSRSMWDVILALPKKSRYTTALSGIL